MPVQYQSQAVSVALAHCEAWSNHDWDTARKALADDVKLTATTTKPIMPDTNLTGVDAYMEGLQAFAGAVVPGTLRVVATLGDEQNALLMVTVKASLGPGEPVTLPGARLYLINEEGKIASEQVVFLIPD